MSSYKSPTVAGSVRIASIASSREKVIDDSILSIEVSYSMEMSSQLRMRIIDPSFLMASANYFQIGREVIYDIKSIGSIGATSPTFQRVSQVFEISNVTLTNGAGNSPVFDIQCYPKAIQQMKRDKQPGTIKGSGTDYVKNAAAKYGLKFIGEKTTKKRSITKAGGDKQADSVWDVVTRLANDAKFVVFEADGTLIFGSQKWLLNKWGYDGETVRVDQKPKKPRFVQKVNKWVPVQFPSVVKGTPGIFEALEYPTISISENDPFSASEGSATMERTNGVSLRPGMTVWAGPCPNLEGFFLINSVSFNDRTPDPVNITFITPEKEAKEIKQLPVGKKSQQVFINTGTIVQPPSVAITARNGDSSATVAQDARIFPLPDTDNRTNRYPRMKTANLSKTVTEFEPSTLETNTVVSTGNVDLWERPVVPSPSGPKTTWSITMEPFESGGEWRCYLITPIWNVGGQPTELSESAAIAKFQSDGKYLALISGSTRKNAILNARDYGKLLSIQQYEILRKRFPQYARTLKQIPATPGSGN